MVVKRLGENVERKNSVAACRSSDSDHGDAVESEIGEGQDEGIAICREWDVSIMSP